MKEGNINRSDTINPVFEKIAAILENINVSDMRAKEEKSGFKSVINSILQDHSSDKKLAIFMISEFGGEYFSKIDQTLQSDFDIARALIRSSSDNFYRLHKSLKSNYSIAAEVISSMVINSSNFLQIQDFIDSVFLGSPSEKEKLFKFYENSNKISEKILNSDLEKCLLSLKSSDEQLYKKLIEQKVVIGSGKKIQINPKLLEGIEKDILKHTGYSELGVEQKREVKLHIILQKIGCNGSDISNDSKLIFDTILNLVQISENKKLKKEHTKDEKKDNGERNDTSKKENDSTNNDEFLNVDEIEEFIEYTLPNNSYIHSGGNYNISTQGNNTMNITEVEMKNFTSVALKNYINFYNTLYNLGLNFFWDKHKSSFSTLCNNKFGFHYDSGEGITESKTLSVLNLIGKNIGIPEKEMLSNDGKTKEIVGCFKTIGEAKMKFGDIKGSGKINGEVYSDLGANSLGAVESYLKSKELIDSKGGGLNISSWR